MDPKLQALAAFLIRDLDRAERWQEKARTLPVMAARYEGEAHGCRSALAYIAGLAGMGRVETLIERVRAMEAERAELGGGPVQAPGERR